MQSLSVAALTLAVTSTAAFAQNTQMLPAGDGVFQFTAMGYSSMVVVGEQGVLVTDPANPARAQMMIDAVAEMTDTTITHVVLSHEHYDHVGGTGLFSGAEVIIQEDGVAVLDLAVFSPAPKVTKTFDETLKIDLGGISVDLLHHAPGDGVGTSIAWVPKQRVVYSADMYEREEFSIPQFKEDTNFVGVRKILNEMIALDPLYAINSHDDGNSVEALRVNAVMMNELYDAVNARFQDAFASDDNGAVWDLYFSISDQVKLDQYSGWENYETAFPNYVWRMAASMFHGG